MGVSGAGKTTLMDVLAGRKTGGYISGKSQFLVTQRSKKHLLVYQDTVNKMTFILLMLLSTSPATQLGFDYLQMSILKPERCSSRKSWSLWS
ncbi:hypothetical protein LWI28_006789 [Acer negundo]|uniref:ABC transporter domain-containing protein n=1 Tax=Acer negundo TaxID=4023 RepID=A0AAD5ICJ0_ACENE|nr:hypothetical protein LWI28_006789 [Acer negundo]